MKIFIIYAKAGAGHKKAAEALYEVYQQSNHQAEVKLFDALDYTNSFFKRFYNASYLFMITYLRFAWGFFYYTLDLKPVYFLISPLRKIVNFLNSKKLQLHLINEKPDLVISVHFFASEVVAGLITKGLLKAKLVTVLTDFLPHYFWINKGTDFYSVATAQAKEVLIKRGVEKERIEVLGIPVNPSFLKEEDKTYLREKLKFEITSFIILITSGGFGVGPLEEMLHILDNSALEVEVAVVCGKNPSLFAKLKKIKFKKKITIFEFVDNMHELMKASDIIVTKSGGLSTSEALACKLPIIIARPVPGQEIRNCSVLVENKTALRLKDIKDLVSYVSELMKDDIRENYVSNITKVSHPHAVYKIIEFAESVSRK